MGLTFPAEVIRPSARSPIAQPVRDVPAMQELRVIHPTASDRRSMSPFTIILRPTSPGGN